MSIQGGGKFPHGNTPRASESERPRRAAEKRQALEKTEAAPAKTPAKDVFESGGPRVPAHTPAHGISLVAQGNGGLGGSKLDELMGHPSQVKQMSEAITAHAKRLGGEFDTLRTQAQGVVNKLAKAGFTQEAVAESRGELGSLRKNMAQLRGKIAADGRRLKLLKAAAGKMGETKLGEKIGVQLKSIADMEKGWGRTFLALGIAGTMGGSVEGEGQPARLSLGNGGQVDRHALGGYLAANTPGTAASQLLVRLVEEGPSAPSGRLVAEAYAELHADVLTGKLGKALQGLGLWRQAMG